MVGTIAATDEGAAAVARARHERAVRNGLIATELPACAAHCVDAGEALLKRDGKDVHKRSAARRGRYAMLFPCQLSVMKEGKIGEMREMHTQSPIVYLNFGELGRMKLLGSIVRPKSTRYFTLNAKSRDRMNLEEWFDSVIVFPSWYWIGTEKENPEERALAMPKELGDLSGEPEADWESGIAAGSGKTAAAKDDKEPATDKVEVSAPTEKEGGRRPRRQAAAVARKKMYADDSDAMEESDDDDDGHVASPVVVRGKVESFMPTIPPPPKPQPVDAPVRESIAAPARQSLSAPKAAPKAKAASKTKAEPTAKRQKRDTSIVIGSESEDDEEEMTDANGDDDDDIEDASDSDEESFEDDDDDDDWD